MVDKEIEKIMKKNNKIEQNLIKQESNFSEEKIITQTKKINPFIEIIDSSRFDDNIINLNNNIYNTEVNETIENKGSINSINKNQNPNINNNVNEEPMTFNPNKNINFMNHLNDKLNKDERHNENFLTFKNEEETNEIEDNCNIYNSKEFKNGNSEEKEYQYKLNEDNFNINDIIIILKKLIDKIKFNLDKIKDKNINNTIMNNKKFVDKIMEIKNNVIKVFDKIIEEETFKKNEIQNKDNPAEIQLKFNFDNYCLDGKINEINKMENIYKTQIMNLKNKIINFEKENNELKRIIQNSRNLLEDLIYKNKLLSSKLIKYKTLYENNKYNQ